MISALITMYNNGLLLHEILHGMVALPVAFMLWRRYKNAYLPLVLLFIVYGTDVDHLVDYFIAYSSFNLTAFVSTKYFKEGFAYVPFHAWEWVILLFIYWKFSAVNRIKPFLLTLIFGLAIHLIWDSVSFNKTLFYFIIYRYWFI